MKIPQSDLLKLENIRLKSMLLKRDMDALQRKSQTLYEEWVEILKKYVKDKKTNIDKLNVNFETGEVEEKE